MTRLTITLLAALVLATGTGPSAKAQVNEQDSVTPNAPGSEARLEVDAIESADRRFERVEPGNRHSRVGFFRDGRLKRERCRARLVDARGFRNPG